MVAVISYRAFAERAGLAVRASGPTPRWRLSTRGGNSSGSMIRSVRGRRTFRRHPRRCHKPFVASLPMRFLHAADLHLDTPVEGLRSYGREVNDALRDASLRAFDNLVRLALARQVSFCVFSGDIYDGAERGPGPSCDSGTAWVASRLRASARSSSTATTIRSTGSGRPSGTGPTGSPSSVRTSSSRWGSRPTASRSPCTASATAVATRIRTWPCASRGRTDRACRSGSCMPTSGEPAATATTHPAPWTTSEPPGSTTGRSAMCTPVATLSEGDPWVVYPGNLQGRHHGAAELGAKGAVLVEVTPAGTVAATSFVELDVIRFESVEVSIDDLEDIGQLQDRLSDVADDLRAAAGRCSVVVRATLVGRGPRAPGPGPRHGRPPRRARTRRPARRSCGGTASTTGRVQRWTSTQPRWPTTSSATSCRGWRTRMTMN